MATYSEDQENIFKVLVDDDTISADIIGVYLDLAFDKIYARYNPFNQEDIELPLQYEHLVPELGARMYLKRGAEGETVHNENGVNRTYGSANDEDLLSRITPLVKVG